MPDLLQTKLTPPSARVEHITRSRLLEQFSQCLEHPLTLICAPAGYGKTSLLGEWLNSGPAKVAPIAWLSLDDDDNDPIRFLTYLARALSSVSNIAGNELLSLLHSPQPPSIKAIVTVLISYIEAFPQRFVLVLDDYHLISAKPVHETMTYLLDHLPTQMCIVITSREDPPFPLARLRGRGQLGEMRADDLRFTMEETRQFLKQILGSELSADDINDLDARTEGWIAGLQLAALAMKGRQDLTSFISAFSGSHRYVLDYLTEEVLHRQPPSIQRFLLQTSILNRLNGSLCDAVTGRTDGQLLLEQIEHENLFLFPLDDERYWYRYHHLFADILRNTLRRQSDNNVAELHRHACQWLAGEKLIDEAVNHAIAAQDFELAATVMESLGTQYFADNWHSFGLRLNANVPDEVLHRHPLLTINMGMWHGLLGRAALAQKYVDIARVGLTQATLPAPQAEEIMGYADAMEAMSAIVNNDMEQAFQAAESALQRLPSHHLHLRALATLLKGHVCQRRYQLELSRANYSRVVEMGKLLRDISWITRAMVHIGDTYVLEGHLRAAELTYRSVIEKAVETKTETVLLLNVGIAYGGLALIQFEQNRLQEAALSATRCIERCEEILPYHALIGYAVLARIYGLFRDELGCQHAIRRIRQTLSDYPSMATRIYVLYVTHLWVRDELYGAIQLFLTDQQAHTTEPFDTQLFQFMTIRSLIEQADDNALGVALNMLDVLHAELESTGSVARRIEMLALKALALNALGRSDQAINILENALELAEPEGFIRTFVDEGSGIASLLHTIRSRNRLSVYGKTLLAAFQLPSTPQVITPESLDPLSSRELEVLRLVVDGASNREIADQLVVSLGTVKKHINNIFLKLDAHSRTQAVAIARRENLI